jgi:hypothetical protein
MDMNSIISFWVEFMRLRWKYLLIVSGLYSFPETEIPLLGGV